MKLLSLFRRSKPMPPQRKTLDKPILDIRSGGVCVKFSPGSCGPCACLEPCKHNLGYNPIVEYEE